MPAHKRSVSENLDDAASTQHHHAKQSRHEPETEETDEEHHKEDEKVEDEDSEESPYDSSEEKSEFVSVELPDIRKEVQCPICLGIIKKTRTVMECLHRFCRECIDKSMRLGNNECPACRTHCASRRSLRDDPNYDALIAALYPDIDKYEEEESAFLEEDKTRNKQIQASIAQTSQRQTEALIKRRTLGKDSAGAYITRSQRHSRRRRNSRSTDFQGSDDEDEKDNSAGKDSSSNDEHFTEVRQRRNKKRGGIRPSRASYSAANSDGGCIENDLEVSRESRGISPGFVWTPEMLAWGRGGARSNTRHGSANGCSSKSSRSTRLSKLVDYLRSLEENNDELDVHVMLISLDRQSTPSLQQPYLCCRPSLSIKHLYEYVAHQTSLRAEDVEILLVKGHHNVCDKSTLNHSTSTDNQNPVPPLVVNPCSDELHLLGGQDTLGGIKANGTSSMDHLILAYRQKETT